MAYEQRENSGSMFPNDKQGVESRPDFCGKAMIGNVMYYVDAWTKNSNGREWFSISFKPINKVAQRQAYNEPRAESPKKDPARNAGGGIAAMDDDCPW